jgi:hypothetical protein
MENYYYHCLICGQWPCKCEMRTSYYSNLYDPHCEELFTEVKKLNERLTKIERFFDKVERGLEKVWNFLMTKKK